MKKIYFKIFLLLFSCPAFSQCYDAVKTNGNTTIYLQSGGTLWSSGRNSSGVLGHGSGIETFSAIYPIAQVGSDTDWSPEFSIGGHVLALKNNGTLWAWGLNISGQCGNGTIGPQNFVLSPQQIGTASWKSIATGSEYSLGIQTDGTLWSWGKNDYGQLGNGNTAIANALVPTQIGTATNWAKVFTKNRTSFAIKTDGTLWAWGLGANYLLGYTSTSSEDYKSPHQVGTASWLMVSPNSMNSVVGIQTNGTLWGWGANSPNDGSNDVFYGNGYPDSHNYQNGPIQIGVDSDWKSVYHISHGNTFLTKTNGTLWCWGLNTSGSLADGTTMPRYAPVQLGTDINWLFNDYNYAIKANHSLYTWGYDVITSTTITAITQVGSGCSLGLADIQNISSISAYPNPATDKITVDYHLSENAKVAISIVNNLGQIIYSQENDRMAGENSNYIDTTNFSSGLYFIVVKNGRTQSIIKMIKD